MDELLAHYAAGHLSAPLHALVETHLALSDRNRGFVSTLEQVAASDLEDTAPSLISDRDARLEAIFASNDDEDISAPATELPAPLVRLIGRDLADIPWRTVLPGIREYHVETGGEEATLYWIKAGKRMPSHTHDGSEITVVLRGAFSDATGRYGRGDVAIADAELDHRPVADAGEDCICFAVTDAPLRLTGPVGRIIQRIFGH